MPIEGFRALCVHDRPKVDCVKSVLEQGCAWPDVILPFQGSGVVGGGRPPYSKKIVFSRLQKIFKNYAPEPRIYGEFVLFKFMQKPLLQKN